LNAPRTPIAHKANEMASVLPQEHRRPTCWPSSDFGPRGFIHWGSFGFSSPRTGPLPLAIAIDLVEQAGDIPNLEIVIELGVDPFVRTEDGSGSIASDHFIPYLYSLACALGYDAGPQPKWPRRLLAILKLLGDNAGPNPRATELRILKYIWGSFPGDEAISVARSQFEQVHQWLGNDHFVFTRSHGENEPTSEVRVKLKRETETRYLLEMILAK
jgi:hypothetical protein